MFLMEGAHNDSSRNTDGDWWLQLLGTMLATWTTVMLSRPIVLTEPPYCSCRAVWASSWTCCCCWVGVIRKKSCGSSPMYTCRQKAALHSCVCSEETLTAASGPGSAGFWFRGSGGLVQ